MTSYETASIVIAAIALTISTFSILAAKAAERSAIAAEKQARHAETQAAAALGQAETAERQLTIMKAVQSFDSVARIVKGRRLVLMIDEAIGTLVIQARRARDGNEIAAARDKLKSMLIELEDAMHLFPPGMWRRIGNFIEMTEGELPRLIKSDVSDEAVEPLRREAVRLSNAMQIEIGVQWAVIAPPRDDE